MMASEESGTPAPTPASGIARETGASLPCGINARRPMVTRVIDMHCEPRSNGVLAKS